MAEDITAPLEHLGTVTQAIVPPAITGAEITRLDSIKALVPRALENLASGIGDLGSSLSRLTSQMQEPSGPLVTRDQQGNIQVQPQSNILFGPNAEALAHATLHRTVNEAGWRIGEDLTKIQAEHLGDPQGFMTAAQGYLASQQQGFAAGGTRIGNAINEEANQRIAEIHNGMVLKQGAQDMQDARTAVDVRINSLNNEMYQLALQGMMQSPQFAQKQTELEGQYGALKSNPRLGVTPEEADASLAQQMSTYRGASIIGGVDADYHDPHVGAVGAQKNLYERVGALPNLSDAERSQLITKGNARIGFLQGQNADAVAANTQKLDSLEKLINLPRGNEFHLEATPGLLQPIIDEATRTGDYASIVRAQTIMQTHPIKQATEGLLPHQIDQAHGVTSPVVQMLGEPPRNFSGIAPRLMNDLQRDFNLTKDQAAGIVGNLGHETGGFTTMQEQRPLIPGSRGGYGYAQWTGPRRTAFENFAASHGGVDSYEANYGNLKRELANNPGILMAVRQTSTAEGAVRAFYPFESGGDTRAVSAFASREKYARMALGQGNIELGGAPQPRIPGTVISANGVAFTEKQLSENPYLASELVKIAASDRKNRDQIADNTMKGIERGLNNLMLPSAENLALAQQTSQGNPRLEQRYSDIEDRVRGQQLGTAAAPYAGGQALIDQAKVNASGADFHQQLIAAEAYKSRNAIAREIDENPAAAAARIGITRAVLPPLDVSNPQAIAAGIAVRGGIAQRMMDRGGLPPRSAVFPPDRPAVESLLSTGSPEAKGALLDTVANLPEPIREATMADPSAKAAVLSMAHSGQPQLMSKAYAFLDQEYRRNPMTFDDTFGKGTLADLRNWQDDLSQKTPEQIADRMMKADDPATFRAQNELRTQADTSLKNVTGKDIAGKMVSWYQRWTGLGGDYLPLGESLGGQTSQVLLDDYRRAYQDSFVKNANPTAADKYAMEVLTGIRDGGDTGGGKWHISPASGGRVMAWAPERSPAYPSVNGSKDYIATQAADFVTRSMKELGVEAPLLGATMESRPDIPLRFGARPYALVPDARTQSEMTSGARPSYQVVVQDNNGRLAALPARFTADPDAARAAAQSIPRDLSAMPATVWKSGQF